jgi:hypothetical protein
MCITYSAPTAPGNIDFFTARTSNLNLISYPYAYSFWHENQGQDKNHCEKDTPDHVAHGKKPEDFHEWKQEVDSHYGTVDGTHTPENYPQDGLK